MGTEAGTGRELRRELTPKIRRELFSPVPTSVPTFKLLSGQHIRPTRNKKRSMGVRPPHTPHARRPEGRRARREGTYASHSVPGSRHLGKEAARRTTEEEENT